MAGSYVVGGARTPTGRLSGALASMSGTDLGGVAIAGALSKAGVTPDQVDYVIMGQVLQAGAGQITARRAAVNAGIPMGTPATTINKVCLSGLHAIYLADQMIASGDADIVVAGGMESMSNAPYLMTGARGGFRMGHGKALDAMIHDGLWDAYNDYHMGNTGEVVAERYEDRGAHARQFFGQDDVRWHVGRAAPIVRVEPMHAHQVRAVWRVWGDLREFLRQRRGEAARICELGERRQDDLSSSKVLDRVRVRLFVDDIAFQAQALQASSSILLHSRLAASTASAHVPSPRPAASRSRSPCPATASCPDSKKRSIPPR